MISSEFLIALGIITALLWMPAGYRLYRYYIPMNWIFAVSFILGSLGISLFYYEIEHGLLGGFFVGLFQTSRVLWTAVLVTTSALAVSVLVYKR